MKLYLHQFLSGTGAFSSKKAVFDALKNREITVDGKVVANSCFQLRPGKRTVSWKGKSLSYRNEKLYVLLNKPVGYLSSRLTKRDRTLGKKSVFQLLDDDVRLDDVVKRTLFCVGRLDEDTSGLLILTNDGVFCSKLTNPRSGVLKTYEAVAEPALSESDRRKLEEGVVIDLEENGRVTKYRTRKCSIRKTDAAGRRLLITLTEGRKREIRRMFQAVGVRVVSLARLSIGKLNIKEMEVKKGEYVLAGRQFISDRL